MGNPKWIGDWTQVFSIKKWPPMVIPFICLHAHSSCLKRHLYGALGVSMMGILGGRTMKERAPWRTLCVTINHSSASRFAHLHIPTPSHHWSSLLPRDCVKSSHRCAPLNPEFVNRQRHLFNTWLIFKRSAVASALDKYGWLNVSLFIIFMTLFLQILQRCFNWLSDQSPHQKNHFILYSLHGVFFCLVPTTGYILDWSALCITL